jgi:hypothetical protein
MTRTVKGPNAADSDTTRTPAICRRQRGDRGRLPRGIAVKDRTPEYRAGSRRGWSNVSSRSTGSKGTVAGSDANPIEKRPGSGACSY